ncbi:hypothetical protein J2T08_002781 [Neorhizobium galegae]|nr:hypothetical protein [Neorhizobium galegae]
MKALAEPRVEGFYDEADRIEHVMRCRGLYRGNYVDGWGRSAIATAA